MADYHSSLPVRSEADGTDERLQTKLVDASNPDTQQLEIDTDNNAHVEVHGNRADDAADIALQLSEEGRVNGRGDYEVDENSKPASVGMIAHTRNTTKDETHQSKRVSAVDSGVDTDVTALDVAIRDESGNPFTSNNPLPVFVSEHEGDEIVDPDTATSVAKDASANHDYQVTAAKEFVGSVISCSASGLAKFELKRETAVASGTYDLIETQFNSTANPNCKFDLAKILKANAQINIRITKTNLDNQVQNLYSTIYGVEK